MRTARTRSHAALAAATVGSLLAAAAATAPSAAAAVGTYSQPAPITINDDSASAPYGNSVTVSGSTRPVTDLNLTLAGFGHEYPDDVIVMLVGPRGQKAVVMADVGGSGTVTDLNLTLDDEAAAALPDETDLASGSFRPADYDTATAFPAPAPASTGAGSALSVFDGTDPNGTWQLFVADDAGSDVGSISRGWSLQITTPDVPAAPVFTAPANPSTDNDGAVAFVGTAPAGSTVNVYDGATHVATTAAAATGGWGTNVQGLADGAHTFTAVAVDAYGNSSAASSPLTVTVDTVAPTVVRARPAKGSDRVRPGANVKARFGEAVRPATVTKKTVTLVAAGEKKAIRATVTYDATKKLAKLNPRHKLASGTTFKVVVSTGVKDVAGNALDQKARGGDQAMVWKFTTR
jgi:subtilisin-like proprotein convertase family protein